MMRDTVWVDEICISDTDLSKGYGQALKRGLSRQELCTCVTIDIHKNPVAVGNVEKVGVEPDPKRVDPAS